MLASKRLALLIAAVLGSFASADTCDPVTSNVGACKPNTGLNTANYHIDFTQQKSLPDQWTLANYENVSFGPHGAEFTFNKRYDAPNIWTDFFIFFGKVDVVMQVAPGQGIVSSSVLISDDYDEIDWEFSGNNFGQTTSHGQVQTNYYGKGNTGYYDRGANFDVNQPQASFHTYTVDWNKDGIKWSIDGKNVRTLLPSQCDNDTHQYPQSPMKLQLGVWDGGDPDGNPGTVGWAGGYTNLSQAPFTMYVKSVTITNYNPGYGYNYTDKSGSWESIQILKAPLSSITSKPPSTVLTSTSSTPPVKPSTVSSSSAGALPTSGTALSQPSGSSEARSTGTPTSAPAAQDSTGSTGGVASGTAATGIGDDSDTDSNDNGSGAGSGSVSSGDGSAGAASLGSSSNTPSAFSGVNAVSGSNSCDCDSQTSTVYVTATNTATAFVTSQGSAAGTDSSPAAYSTPLPGQPSSLQASVASAPSSGSSPLPTTGASTGAASGQSPAASSPPGYASPVVPVSPPPSGPAAVPTSTGASSSPSIQSSLGPQSPPPQPYNAPGTGSQPSSMSSPPSAVPSSTAPAAGTQSSPVVPSSGSLAPSSPPAYGSQSGGSQPAPSSPAGPPASTSSPYSISNTGSIFPTLPPSSSPPTGYSAGSSAPSSAQTTSFTTVISTKFTTVCPEATKLTINDHTYTVSSSTTLTHNCSRYNLIVEQIFAGLRPELGSYDTKFFHVPELKLSSDKSRVYSFNKHTVYEPRICTSDNLSFSSITIKILFIFFCLFQAFISSPKFIEATINILSSIDIYFQVRNNDDLPSNHDKSHTFNHDFVTPTYVNNTSHKQRQLQASLYHIPPLVTNCTSYQHISHNNYDLQRQNRIPNPKRLHLRRSRQCRFSRSALRTFNLQQPQRVQQYMS
ncbi:MAG: hypothetical protein M1820_005263 [Bogoriella megaspora]|nr:MAG: hypothetical protein M1820_005263 [Bogoriella megaspora]